MTIPNPATTDPMQLMVAEETIREELADKLGLRDLSPKEVTREVLEEASLNLINNQIAQLLQELPPSMRKKIALDIMGESVLEVLGVHGVHAVDVSDHGGLN